MSKLSIIGNMMKFRSFLPVKGGKITQLKKKELIQEDDLVHIWTKIFITLFSSEIS